MKSASTKALVSISGLLSSEAFSIGEQMALTALVSLIQRAVKNPKSQKSQALRHVLVNVEVVIEGALAKIPE